MSQQINLYNPALRQPRELVSAVNLAVAAAACLMLVLVVGGVTRYVLHSAATEAANAAQSLKSVQDQLAAVNAQIAAHQPSAKLQQEVAAAQLLLKSREEVLAALATVSIEPGKGFADYLRGLARQSLQGVWLTGVSVGPGNELSIHGRTVNQSLVADYVKRLTSEPVFSGHRFSQLTMAQVAEPPAGSGATAAVPAERSMEFNLLTAPASDLPKISPVAGGGVAAAPVTVASLAGTQP